MTYKPEEFNEIPFQSNSVHTFRQIYAVIYLMKKENMMFKDAIKKAVEYFPRVNAFPSIYDKCCRKLASDKKEFLDWYENGLIIEKLEDELNPAEHDLKIFKELLE